MPTSYFKAAPTEINGQQVIILWLDDHYMHKDDEIKKVVKFFKEKQDCQNIVAMILDDLKQPVYFGKKETVEVLKKFLWKKFPWQSFAMEIG